MEYQAEKAAFQGWVEQTIAQTVDGFVREAEAILKENCRDVMFHTDEFIHWYLTDILQDTAGFAGTEVIRRVVGSAKVKDLEHVQDPAARIRMERICITAAKAFILNRREGFAEGRSYIAALRSAAEKN